MNCCRNCFHCVVESHGDMKPVYRCTRHKDKVTGNWSKCEDATAPGGACGPDLKSFEDGDE